MSGENFCWLVVGFIAGRFVGDSVKDALKRCAAAIRGLK